MSTNETRGSRFSDAPLGGYGAGQRSITKRRGKSRFQMMRDREHDALRSRPFIIGALVFFALVLVIPGYAFYQTYVAPTREAAVRVEDAVYTRGDVVDFIRFNQRLSEDLGVAYELGSSAFEALVTMQQNELAYRIAPRYGITVTSAEVDGRLEGLLGFHEEVTSQINERERESNLAEAKRKFLNRVGLDEETYRDFIRKSMFKEKLRSEVAQNINRIQPHVDVYEVVLFDQDRGTMQQIQRDLDAGLPVRDVVLDFSEDPNVRRTSGSVGWLPRGVRTDLDPFIFGGTRSNESLTESDIPLRALSTGRYDDQSQQWVGQIVAEYNDAREVSDAHFELLSDSAIDDFLNERRGEFNTSVTIDSSIYAWINEQVRYAAIVPTATPVSQFQTLEQLGQGQ